MRSRRLGHNLLEVIIATVIFSTAVVFMTGLWSTYHEAITKNRSRMVAMAIARSELESRIALGFTNLAPYFNSAPIITPYPTEAWVRGRTVKATFQAEFQVFNQTGPNPDPRLARLAKLIVTVRWAEKTGEAVPGPFNKTIVYVGYVFDGR